MQMFINSLDWWDREEDWKQVKAMGWDKTSLKILKENKRKIEQQQQGW